MRPSTFEETGNLRELCKARLRPVQRLKRQAFIDGNMGAFMHYNDLEWREIVAYQQGLGRYGTHA